jgi:hypothetical protein
MKHVMKFVTKFIPQPKPRFNSWTNDWR